MKRLVNNLTRESAQQKIQRSRKLNGDEIGDKTSEWHQISDSRSIHDHQGARQKLSSRHYRRREAGWLPQGQKPKLKNGKEQAGEEWSQQKTRKDT